MPGAGDLVSARDRSDDASRDCGAIDARWRRRSGRDGKARCGQALEGSSQSLVSNGDLAVQLVREGELSLRVTQLTIVDLLGNHISHCEVVGKEIRIGSGSAGDLLCLRLANLTRVAAPFRRPEDLARFTEGLRKAGLPE